MDAALANDPRLDERSSERNRIIAGASDDTRERWPELRCPLRPALKAIANGFYFTAAVVLSGVYMAVGLVSIRHQVFPRWVGGISLLLALVATIPMVGVAKLLIGFPLRTIIICVMLWRGPGRWSPA
jgi:hypothetical protein